MREISCEYELKFVFLNATQGLGEREGLVILLQGIGEVELSPVTVCRKKAMAELYGGRLTRI